MMLVSFDTERVYISDVLEKSVVMTMAFPFAASNKVVLGLPSIAYNMGADVSVVIIYNRALFALQYHEVTTMYSTFALRFAIPTQGIHT